MIAPPPNAVIYNTPVLKCWFGEDGILYFISQKADRTKENYNKLFDLYKELTENGKRKICAVGNISETQALSSELRSYIAQENEKYIKAMALVSESAIAKAVGSIFELLNTYSYPLATFDNKEDALKWIRQYL